MPAIVIEPDVYWIGLNDRTTDLFVCLEYNCRLPTTDADTMLELLGVQRDRF